MIILYMANHGLIGDENVNISYYILIILYIDSTWEIQDCGMDVARTFLLLQQISYLPTSPLFSFTP